MLLIVCLLQTRALEMYGKALCYKEATKEAECHHICVPQRMFCISEKGLGL